ncbi:flavodoxin domain-containing protein [Metallumcola ferriviriculae]|uniref:Flavodoxin domain-containing protein n=1 Tax=Metallumcola ferriviriculae TaxID=3039180 RepID=A0AAU0UR61_9FIRM|nr:flavodoxin domain-containing protein [Desulfitibacteraceae bacterium MK1]
MNTLVAYASKYGCTENCARMLSEKLTGEVDLCDLKTAKIVDLSKYDKVIVGGSIYAGKVRKEVSDFCSTNLNVLKEKNLGLFVCGMLEDQAEMELNNSYPSELLTKALVKEFMGGKFQFKKMKLPEKFIVKMVSKADKSRPALDTSKDVSTISEQTITRFAAAMNNA